MKSDNKNYYQYNDNNNWALHDILNAGGTKENALINQVNVNISKYILQTDYKYYFKGKKYNY